MDQASWLLKWLFNRIAPLLAFGGLKFIDYFRKLTFEGHIDVIITLKGE